MPKDRNIIEPINARLGDVVDSIVQPATSKSKEGKGLGDQMAPPPASHQPTLGRPPIARRLILCLVDIPLSFIFSLWGWQYLESKRRLLGAALVSAAGLLGLIGFGLLGLTVLPDTWGWWL